MEKRRCFTAGLIYNFCNKHMELQSPPSTRATWRVKIDFEIGSRTEPTEEELVQITEFIKQGCTGGEFESEE
ncbi:MAG: hypothetical protein FWE22_01605 [Firmicutes bacterium]|nr:hypothetical protein [Bacillota bacterium]